MYIISTFIIIFLTIVYLIVYSQQLYNEGFEGNYYPKYCQNCYNRGLKGGSNACMSCENCGWCVDPNGYGSCVLGDNRAPYFADCAQYFYNGGLGVYGPNPNPFVNVAPVGPASLPWYQKFLVPWFGGYKQFGNDTTNVVYENPRRYRSYGGSKNQSYY